MNAKYDAQKEVFHPRTRRNPELKAHAYIMASFMRSAIVQEALTDQSHTLHIGTDYDITPDTLPLKDQYKKICPLTSHYRIFRGHQDMAKRFLQTGDDIGLFFEDDADPNRPDWQRVVNGCLDALRLGQVDADCFYLYGREFKRERFHTHQIIEGREVLKLSDFEATEDSPGGRHHVFGCLAYLLTRKGALQLSTLDWEGIPIDVVMPDRINFALLHPSPFNHNRSQGSLTYPSSCKPPAAQTRGPVLAARLHRAVSAGPRVVH